MADLSTSFARRDVAVPLEGRAYEVRIGAGLIAQAAEHIAPLLARPRVAVITDENVAQAHLAALDELRESSAGELAAAQAAHEEIAAKEQRQMRERLEAAMAEAAVHAEVEGHLQRLDRVVPAVGVTAIVGLADARDDVLDATTVSQCAGKGQKEQVACRHKRIWQSGSSIFQFFTSGETSIAYLSQNLQVQRMILSQFISIDWILFL